MARIAIIGAGLAGLIAARELGAGNDVTVFEKARGPGGRMATRYAGAFEFDHGAQFFTARSAGFRRFLERAVQNGVVADWTARFVEIRSSGTTGGRRWDSRYPHFVGTPRMNAVGKWLADGLDLRCGQRVAALDRKEDGWRLDVAESAVTETYDWVILAVPAAQTAALVPSDSSVCTSALAADMHGCYALMLGFDADPGLAFDAALVRDADISWISLNSSKPERPPAPSIVVHSTNAWADAHLDDDRDAVSEHLLDEFARVTGVNPGTAVHRDLHRWRYANIGRRDGSTHVIDAELGLAACGDWFVRGRLEAAFLSAADLARSLRRRLRAGD